MIVSLHHRPGPDREAAVDPAVFDELCALGESLEDGFVASLLAEFMDETRPLIAELRSALRTGDVHTVRHHVHSIRGSSGQLGGVRLVASCDALEELATTGDLRSARFELSALELDYRELCVALGQKIRAYAWQPRTA